MTSKGRVSLITVALVTAIAGTIVVQRFGAAPVQVIRLPDGAALLFYSVAYGTNHVVGPLFGRISEKLPVSWREAVRRRLGARAKVWKVTSPQPQLRVWCVAEIPPATSHPGRSVHAMLADETGFTSGPEAMGFIGPNSSMTGFDFKAFPRRSPNLMLELFERQRTGEHRFLGRFRLENPIAGSFPEWKPELLPARKNTDEVDVTLDNFSTGHGWETTVKHLPGNRTVIRRGPRQPGESSVSSFAVRFLPRAESDSEWTIAGTELGDATGNLLRSTSFGSTSSGAFRSFTISPSLWPNEEAWKLRLEVKRQRGFAPAEMVSFRAIPLPAVEATNLFSIRTNLSGVSISLDRIIRRAPIVGESWSSTDLSQLHVRVTPLPTGVHCDLVKVRAEPGTDVQIPSVSSSDTERTYSLRNVPLDARTIEITFAIHRSRFVEFLVRPETQQEQP
jgi:hypothetical protein